MKVPRIQSVSSLEGKRLLVTFVDGTQKIYDCKQILHLERFRFLNQEAFFKAVTVDPGGYGVSWNDEMDLSEYELWHNGVTVASNEIPAREDVESHLAPENRA
jgi:hypothetical protein